MTNYGDATEAAIGRVVAALERYGQTSIVALSGVPGTGKSFVASIAAQRFTDEPLLVRTVQFHRSYTYEEFVEGMRIDSNGAVQIVAGIFLEWNERALDDADSRYVLLIDEFTRADISAALGELLTYLEHRGSAFLTMYGRHSVRVAPNLYVLATLNPTDRTALNLDSAIIRRLRMLTFLPDPEQMREMLTDRGLSDACLDRLSGVFSECRDAFPNEYDSLMPFGHGIFSQVQDEAPDLHHLWDERIRHLLQRPNLDPHPFKHIIEASYPWRNAGHREPDANPDT